MNTRLRGGRHRLGRQRGLRAGRTDKGQADKQNGPAGERRPRDFGKYGCGPADQETLTFAAMVGPGSPPRLAQLRQESGLQPECGVQCLLSA